MLSGMLKFETLPHSDSVPSGVGDGKGDGSMTSGNSKAACLCGGGRVTTPPAGNDVGNAADLIPRP